ncbi:MAG: hypothetical protein ACYCSB_00855 [bacterium]
MNIQKILTNIITSVVPSLFDPNPVDFKAQHENGVKPVKKAICDNPPNQLAIFKKLIIRNAFLCGCLDFTENLEIEYLIIGYGIKRGNGTDISKVEYAIGNNNSVKVISETKNRIHKYISQASKNEVIIFHNHPKSWINIFSDNIPIASMMDRDTLSRNKYLEPVILFKTLLNKGSIRFYLGENGFVREYKIPNILKIINRLSNIGFQ